MEEASESELGPATLLVGGEGQDSPRRSKSLLAVLLLFSFSSQFLPIEPYLVPYLISDKHFSNLQVTVDIYPCSIYAQLFFTFLMPAACLYLSHKVVIFLGSLGTVATYIIAWSGSSLFSMQVMQVTYGFGMSTRLVFSSYVFHLVSEEEYQTMISLTTATSLLSFMIASELGQLLVLKEVSYHVFFAISLAFLGLCTFSSVLLPKDDGLTSMGVSACFKGKGWIKLLRETCRGRTLKVLSLWSALAYAGFSLVQNYGTNLFDAIDSNSKLNGHVLAASQAAGSLGSFVALYFDRISSKGRIKILIYIVGSALMSIFCVYMAASHKIWMAYLLYIIISGIYQALACFISVQCGKLLRNGQFILLFSLCNVLGLLLETLLQAAVEIAGLPVSAQFLCFSGFFFMATAIFVGFLLFGGQESQSTF
ncbi:uncharacterized protein LOC144700989 [Wolffia australiana]